MRKVILENSKLTTKQVPENFNEVLKMVIYNCPDYAAQYEPVTINGKDVLRKIFPGKGYIALNPDYTYDKYKTANPETETGELLPRPNSQSKWRPCDAAIKTTSFELSPDMKSTIEYYKKRDDLKTVEEIGGIGAYNDSTYTRYDVADWDKSGQTPKGKFFLYKKTGVGGKQFNPVEWIENSFGKQWTFDDNGTKIHKLGDVLGNMESLKNSPERLALIKRTIAAKRNVDPNDITKIDDINVFVNQGNVNLETFDPELKTFLDTVEQNTEDSNFQKKFCVKAIKKLNYYNKSENANAIIQSFPQSTIEAWRRFAYTCANIDRGYFLRFVNDDIDELRVSNSGLGLKSLYKAGRRKMNESLDYRLKTIVRNNLIMLSESKKKSVVESKEIVKVQFKPIIESRNSKKVKVDKLINETFYLINNGFNKKVVNESFWDLAKGFAQIGGSGLISYIKERIVDSIIDKFVPGGSKTWLGGTISKTLSDIPIGDYLNGNAFECEYLTEAIAKGIAEEAVDKFQDKVGASGGFFDVVRNSLIEVVDDTTFASKLKDGISTILCPTISGLKDGLGKVVTSSGIKDAITNAAT